MRFRSILFLTMSLPACGDAERAIPASAAAQAPAQEVSMVSVRVFDTGGQLVGPVQSPRVVKSDEEWRRQLTDEQYRITRQEGTERAFCGTLLDNKRDGVYTCVCCGLPLFASGTKFDSGTGWPSFFAPVAPENIVEKTDRSFGMVRVEIECARCDAHLGHVFEDGPRPTGLRYCLNSESLTFTDRADFAKLADPAAGSAKSAGAKSGSATGATVGASSAAHTTDGAEAATATAVFAGGCFWCVEAVFEELDGVKDAVSGYAGGAAETANYEAVCRGGTKHAEAVQIVYDPSKISYEELLEVHFATHDPTTLNRQGADVGDQYRSAVFWANEQERTTAQVAIDGLKAAGVRVVTTLEPLEKFFPAENYHQNHVCENPNQGYVRAVALPKVEKVREKFADKLKDR
ncbi:MAG: bifunctional methionine sulfoxide reductase B/A protein [Candidatus Eiseniibacteriota bacterium]